MNVHYIIYVRGCPSLLLNQLLWHLGNEVLQIEWHEICHILKLSFHKTFLCERSHVLSQWFDVLYKSGIRMVDDLHALGCAISEEIDSSLVQVFLISISIYDVGLDRSYLLQSSCHHLCINFHTAGIQHRNDECIFLLRMLS